MKPQSQEESTPFEAVSALIDGEHPPAGRRQLIERCAREPGWSERWSLYLLAGDALRSAEVAACHRPGFAARFGERFASEAIYLAPLHDSAATRRHAWMGGALAAAVAVLAFVLVPLAQTAQPRPLLARAVAPEPANPAGLNPDDPEPLLLAGSGWD